MKARRDVVVSPMEAPYTSKVFRSEEELLVWLRSVRKVVTVKSDLDFHYWIAEVDFTTPNSIGHLGLHLYPGGKYSKYGDSEGEYRLTLAKGALDCWERPYFEGERSKGT